MPKRVLRPGGIALLVFLVYLGMRSHYLDYITTLPGLHWIFGADTLVSAVNSILNENPKMTRFGTCRQPAPRMSFDGRRQVLSLLNSLGGSHLCELFRRFSVLQINRHVVLRSKARSPRPHQGTGARVLADAVPRRRETASRAF